MKHLIFATVLFSGAMLVAQDSVTVIAPTSGCLIIRCGVPTDFRVAAVAHTKAEVRYMQVYVDFNKIAESNHKPYIDTVIRTFTGNHRVTVQYKKSDGTFVKTTFFVNAIATATFSSPPVPPLIIGEHISHQFEATAGSGNYTWSVQEGRLPFGLALSSSGELYGTPRLPGNWTAKIRASDTNPANAGLIVEMWLYFNPTYR
jgi:hypothetical protein